MGRPTTKSELIQVAEDNYRELKELIVSLTEKELSIPFDFVGNTKKKEAHWRRDRNLRDVLIHLYEWHQLVLLWVQANENGEERAFFPEPYNWRTYGDMNMEIWRKHQYTTLEEAKELLEKSHRDMMNMLDKYSDEQLFKKGVYQWVGGSTLGAYFISNTSSHYNWAMKKLREHRRICKSVVIR